MADQVTTPRRVLPNGRPAPDAAPDSALLDRDDLTKLYQALRTGHSVGLGPDGHVYVHTEAGTPIDAPSQAFVEGKLAEVKDMLRMGFSVEIHADGTINANTPGSTIMYRSDPRPELGDEDRATIRAALKDGDVVGIRPDGTLEIMQPEHPHPRPYAEDIDRIMTELDHQISSGTLADQAKSGSGLVIFRNEAGNTQFDYNNMPKSTATPIAFPAEIRDANDPTAVDALRTQATELQQRAAALRETYNQNFEKQASDVGQQRDAVAREQTAAHQQAAIARQQQKDELKQADAATTAANAATTRAGQLEAAGRGDEAAEQRELALAKTAEATELRQRAAGAGDAATKLDHQAIDAGSKVQQLDAQLVDIKQRASSSETAADALENRAKAMTEAAGHLAEANRLDGAAAEARADGDSEAAQLVQNAADYERRLGTEASAKVDRIPLDEDLVDETLKPDSVGTAPPVAWATMPASSDPANPDLGSGDGGDGAGGATVVATTDPDPSDPTAVATEVTAETGPTDTDALGDPALTAVAAATEGDDVLGTAAGPSPAAGPLDDPLGVTSSADASFAAPADSVAAADPQAGDLPPAEITTDDIAGADGSTSDPGSFDTSAGIGDDFVALTDDPDAGGEIA